MTERKNKGVVRYKWEYKNFLAYVQKGKVEHAVIYAKSLRLDRTTLVHWLSQPEIREAMRESIDKLVDGMRQSGSKDWRMWREYLKLLGVDETIDITSDGERLETQPIIISDIKARNVEAQEQTAPDDTSS